MLPIVPVFGWEKYALAGAFLDEWCVQVMRSQLEPMKKVVRMLRRHRPLLLNWFRARGQISAGSVEGLNFWYANTYDSSGTRVPLRRTHAPVRLR